MKELINEKKRRYLMDGIVADIQVSTKEKERHTFLGSTDRKAYTLKVTASWLDERFESYVEIQPYEKDVPQILETIERNVKHECAQKVYEKHFK